MTEVFYLSADDARAWVATAGSIWSELWNDSDPDDDDDPGDSLSGYWYWHCFPGCLPDSDPFGPFVSEDDARADADQELSA